VSLIEHAVMDIS